MDRSEEVVLISKKESETKKIELLCLEFTTVRPSFLFPLSLPPSLSLSLSQLAIAL